MRTYAFWLASSGERPNIDPDVVKPGWGALGLVVLLGIVLALLMWSFVRQLRKVRFTEEPDTTKRDTAQPRATGEESTTPDASASAGDDERPAGS